MSQYVCIHHGRADDCTCHTNIISTITQQELRPHSVTRRLGNRGIGIKYVHNWRYFRMIFRFLNLYKVGRTPWTGDLPVVRPLAIHREQYKHIINAHRHPFHEWDSNPRSKCSSGRRRFMPRPRSQCDRHFLLFEKRRNSITQTVMSQRLMKILKIINCKIALKALAIRTNTWSKKTPCV
jgi:hypothetical protein